MKKKIEVGKGKGERTRGEGRHFVISRESVGAGANGVIRGSTTLKSCQTRSLTCSQERNRHVEEGGSLPTNIGNRGT